MKAMMSARLRNILNDPDSARQLQKKLSTPNTFTKSKKSKIEDKKSIFSIFIGKLKNPSSKS